jgi:hypothetical protein
VSFALLPRKETAGNGGCLVLSGGDVARSISGGACVRTLLLLLQRVRAMLA